jgi:hypothetical protein
LLQVAVEVVLNLVVVVVAQVDSEAILRLLLLLVFPMR